MMCCLDMWLQPFQPTAAPSASTLAGWMANPNPPAQHAPVATGPAALSAPPNSGLSLASMLNVIGDFPDKFKMMGRLLSCHGSSVSIIQIVTCYDPLLVLVICFVTKSKIPLALILLSLSSCSNQKFIIWCLLYLLLVPKKYVVGWEQLHYWSGPVHHLAASQLWTTKQLIQSIWWSVPGQGFSLMRSRQ